LLLLVLLTWRWLMRAVVLLRLLMRLLLVRSLTRPARRVERWSSTTAMVNVHHHRLWLLLLLLLLLVLGRWRRHRRELLQLLQLLLLGLVERHPCRKLHNVECKDREDGERK
jgi:hypothetical protein